MAEEQTVQGVYANLSYWTCHIVMLLGLNITKPAKYIFQVQVMFV